MVYSLGIGSAPTDAEKPLYCLLEDDKLITKTSVETDLLLEPIPGETTVEENHVRLLITVSVRPSGWNYGNSIFG